MTKRMFKNVLFATLFMLTSSTFAQFKTTWNVVADQNGKLEVTIPTHKGTQFSYDYEVDWGDGSTTIETGDAYHSYVSSGAGPKMITITARSTNGFPGIFFKEAIDNDAEELVTVNDWGGSSFGWQTFAFAFAGCINLTDIPSNSPDLSAVTDLSYAFMGATSFNDADINSWQVSNVTNMRGLFAGATSFNQSIQNWNVSAVEDMSSMFANATSFNQDFRNAGTNWNTANVKDMSHMLEGTSNFNQYIGYWNIGSVEDMNNMLSGSNLSGCNYQTTLSDWLSASNTPNNIALGADGLHYFATADRLSLTGAPYNWEITGDIQTATDVCDDPSLFITEWEIPVGGASIEIPTRGILGKTYDYTVDWGDGSSIQLVTGTLGAAANASHTYSSGGIYQVKIGGDFPTIYFNDNVAAGKDYIVDIVQWGDIKWASFLRAFRGCTNLRFFNSITPPDLSGVSSLESMFFGASSFNGQLQNWDVSTITQMASMFNGASSFTGGGISNWENGTNTVANVVNMAQMFRGASSFNLNINGWNTSSNISLLRTFSGAASFDQPLGNWDVSKVTNMQETFAGAAVFDQDLSKWQIKEVTTMKGMFAQAPMYNNHGNALEWERPIGDPNGESSLQTVTNMDQMFRLAANFNADIVSWDVSEVRSMVQMFQATPFQQNINGWNVSNVRTMEKMFLQSDFNQDISSWNVVLVENMSAMFQDADQFNIDISSWNVSNVTNMSGMFAGNNLFNQSLEGWERSGSTLGMVENMAGMFNGATAYIQDINTWDVSNVRNMSNMFGGATLFNGDITSWDVGMVENMFGMFKSADNFNQDISVWNVSNVQDMGEMFNGANIFNQPIGNWERTTGIPSSTSRVTNMEKMFLYASDFDQNIGNWNISQVSNMSRMLENCGMLKARYDNALIGWVATAQSGITLGALNLNFCTAFIGGSSNADTQLERAPYLWTITGDTYDCLAARINSSNSPLDNALSDENLSPLRMSGSSINQIEDQFRVNTTSDGSIQLINKDSQLKTGTIHLSLYTANGKLVYEGMQSAESGLISTEALSKGIYMLRINSGSVTETEKIVIQ